MSTREILQELQKLSPPELAEVRSCLDRLAPQTKKHPLADANLRAEYVNGELLMVADRTIWQWEIEAILNDFP